jgi:UPF0755 protein
MDIHIGRRIAILGSIGCLAILLLVLFLWPSNKDFPNGSPGPRVDVSVPSGASGSQIARSLERLGVVQSAMRFIDIELRDKRSQGISPGVHSVHTHLPSAVALNEMLDPTLVRGLIKIGEATTFQDVLKAIRASQSISYDYSPTHSFILPPYVPSKSLEGIIAPADYSFALGTKATAAIQSMIDTFAHQAASTGIESGYQKYSPYQILTIASMLQIEGDPLDYGKVARVIYNRLHIGMALQLNSTVQYAANLRGRISLSTNATRIDSPYNTYRYVGLPPTPISNPSSAAIRAALHPSEGDWLYFITVKPHDTRFTNSYSEFEAWVTLYNKNLRAGVFR